MITFFYEFDYDDNLEGHRTLIFDSNRPTNRTQMNAHVYALAEKYQVHDLKTHAMEKFVKGASWHDKNDMLAAAWTVYKVIELPPNDIVLRDLVVNMWFMGAADFADAEDATDPANCIGEIPELITRMFAKIAQQTCKANIRFTCKKCKISEIVARTKAMKHEFRCKACKSTEVDEEVALEGTFQKFKKFW